MTVSKPWLSHYDQGVPATLAPYPVQPLFAFLTESARKYPDGAAILSSAHLPALGRQKRIVSYRQLDAESDAMAAALVDLGVQKGDPVAIVMPNCAQFVIACFAILKAGGVICATNPTYPAAKMASQLKDCGAKTVFTLSLFYNTIKSVQANTDLKNVIVTNIKEYLPPVAQVLFTLAREKKDGHRITKAAEDHAWGDLLTRYQGQKANVSVSADDPALFQYTGGTTGISKAAVATHQALVCNVLQCQAWLNSNVPGNQEITLAAIPLFHVFGMVAVMGFAVGVGACMVMVPNPRDIKEVLEVIDACKPTLFMGVPAMYNAINNNPDVLAGKYNLRSIRACISGSAPLPPVTKRRFEELTGGKLVEGYGLSETPTACCVNPLGGVIREGSIGLPITDVDMRIISMDDGLTELPIGEVGELIIWGPQLMSGYNQMPTETNNALRLRPDGKKWLYTGDIARMDEDGYFYIVDRKKDMALIGGFNVYPNAVEKAILEHPAVQEVGVAAVPHPNPEKAGQESLKAWVVLKPGQSVTFEELIKFCEQHLARYEVPTRIEFVKELPKTTVGKVLRRELVQMEMANAEKRRAGKVP